MCYTTLCVTLNASTLCGLSFYSGEWYCHHFSFSLCTKVTTYSRLTRHKKAGIKRCRNQFGLVNKRKTRENILQPSSLSLVSSHLNYYVSDLHVRRAVPCSFLLKEQTTFEFAERNVFWFFFPSVQSSFIIN